MDGSPDIPIGERIRFYRQAHRKTQVVVAGLAGITEEYLSQIERGLKTPTITLLHRLARILGVRTAALLGEPSYAPTSRIHPVASEINRMLTGYDFPHVTEINLVELDERVRSAWTYWQTSPTRFTDISALLPHLVRDVEGACRSTTASPDATEHRRLHQVAADLYFLIRTFTKRIGRVDLSLLAADRAMRAAESADDPLRIAAAKWNLGQVLLATNEPDGAEEITRRGAEELQPSDDAKTIAMNGALWLIAAVSSVRNGDAWTARDRLREYAQPAADRTGEGNVFWTVFGPTNVGLHAVSVEMEAGEAATALRIADQIDASACPSIERRATFALEIARCYDQRRDDAGVLVHLLVAEREAPEDMRYNPLARDLARGLLKRARPSLAPQVRELAERIELLT